MSKISVIVPVYNVESYIEKCLESIKNQDYDNFECLLVDDGSTDNSILLAKKIIGNDKRFIIVHKENGGLSSARNEGINKSSGDCLVFVDSDDIIHSKFLSKLMSNLNDSDFSMCSFKHINSQNSDLLFASDENKGLVLEKDKLLNLFLYRKIKFVIPSILFRKDFLVKNNLLFKEEIKFSEDQLFMWLCILCCNKASYQDEELYGYYIRQNSIMTGSKFETIYKATEIYRDFTENIKEKYSEYIDDIKYIYPRWSLGVLYTAAKILKKDEFDKLYDKLDGKKIASKLKDFKEVKAKVLSYMLFFSKTISYHILRRI